MLLGKDQQEPLHSEDRAVQKGCVTERTDSGAGLRQAVMEPVHPKKRRSRSEGAEAGGARCSGLQGGARDRLLLEVRVILR